MITFIQIILTLILVILAYLLGRKAERQKLLKTIANRLEELTLINLKQKYAKHEGRI